MRTFPKIFSTFLLMTSILFFVKMEVLADSLCYENTETGYCVYYDDRAELLTAHEKEKLVDTMKEITTYGNVSFVTTNSNPDSIDTFMRNYYYQKFDQTSGVIFYIDMDNRKIGVFSNGEVYNHITSSKADTITDNVYEYATDGDYFKCANTAYEQIYTVLQGGKIAQPMKYIGNALLALLTAMIFHFFVVIKMSSLKRTSGHTMAQAAFDHAVATKPSAVKLSTSKRYSPRSSGSGSGGSSGGGGGGGGSHSF